MWWWMRCGRLLLLLLLLLVMRVRRRPIRVRVRISHIARARHRARHRRQRTRITAIHIHCVAVKTIKRVHRTNGRVHMILIHVGVEVAAIRQRPVGCATTAATMHMTMAATASKFVRPSIARITNIEMRQFHHNLLVKLRRFGAVHFLNRTFSVLRICKPNKCDAVLIDFSARYFAHRTKQSLQRRLIVVLWQITNVQVVFIVFRSHRNLLQSVRVGRRLASGKTHLQFTALLDLLLVQVTNRVQRLIVVVEANKRDAVTHHFRLPNRAVGTKHFLQFLIRPRRRQVLDIQIGRLLAQR
mmetsp:Transcript_56067/g.93453  ORF Transcript_56067/g.93453 Transcript_56067/m.93453 type:complete len:299 (-) Transcript_56067:759-1655(-)